MGAREPQPGQPNLQALNRAKEKKDAADETAKTRCKICFREISPKRQCGGHGGGDGGKSDSDHDSDNASDDKKRLDENLTNSKPDQSVESEDNLASLFNEEDVNEEENENIDSEIESTKERFNPDIIALLVADKKLLIETDSELGTITIKLKCDPKSLSDEQKRELKKFVDAIQEELDEFLDECKKKNLITDITDGCKKIEQDNMGNILSLRISLPTPKLYDAFIQRLANNLVPIKRLDQQEKVEANRQVGINEFNPTPLSKKPILDANKKMKSLEERKMYTGESIESVTNNNDEDRSQKSFNPTPFSIKPKG